MGEMAELMLDGTLCRICGMYLDLVPQGFPVACEDCEELLSKTTTILPSRADIGTEITIKSCNKSAVTNVKSPSIVMMELEGELFDAKWKLVRETENSQTYRIEYL
jgi:hypothetical protein